MNSFRRRLKWANAPSSDGDSTLDDDDEAATTAAASLTLALAALTAPDKLRNLAWQSASPGASSWGWNLSTKSSNDLVNCSRDAFERCFCMFRNVWIINSRSSFTKCTRPFGLELFMGKNMPVCLYWLGLMLKLAYSTVDWTLDGVVSGALAVESFFWCELNDDLGWKLLVALLDPLPLVAFVVQFDDLVWK